MKHPIFVHVELMRYETIRELVHIRMSRPQKIKSVRGSLDKRNMQDDQRNAKKTY